MSCAEPCPASCTGKVTTDTFVRFLHLNGPVYARRTSHYCPLAKWPRPGPQIPARRCEHAASGCNYPEGDCIALCLVVAPASAA